MTRRLQRWVVFVTMPSLAKHIPLSFEVNPLTLLMSLNSICARNDKYSVEAFEDRVEFRNLNCESYVSSLKRCDLENQWGWAPQEPRILDLEKMCNELGASDALKEERVEVQWLEVSLQIGWRDRDTMQKQSICVDFIE